MPHHPPPLGLGEACLAGTNNSSNNSNSNLNSSKQEGEGVECLVDSERPNLPNLVLEVVCLDLPILNPRPRRRAEVCSVDNNLRILTPVNQPLVVSLDLNSSHNSNSSSNQQDCSVRQINNSPVSRLRCSDPRVSSPNSNNKEEVYLVNLRISQCKVYNWVDPPITLLNRRAG